ncbi:hypothetical protein SUGI_0627740 [Cryptomeria japonica]|nr:hypothetical protein SUGI_0627740 [Cryptomeria japonica]
MCPSLPPRVSAGAEAGYAWHQRPKSAAFSRRTLHADESGWWDNVAVGVVQSGGSATGGIYLTNRKMRPYRR